jgi:hypothetical protein
VPTLAGQVNYLGPYALTRLLEDTLQRSAPAKVRASTAAAAGKPAAGWLAMAVMPA